MQVALGKEGLKKSWQDEFKETTECVHCGGESRIGFVAHENYEDNGPGPFVCDLHDNQGKGDFWLHDCCCVAVYFCTDCLFPTAKYNQA